MLVVWALLSGVRMSAQATSGVTGVVTDSSGGIVIGAKVTLTDPGTGFAATAQTNSLGVYQFSQVPPGEHYILSITNENFRTLTIRDVALAVGTKETRDVELQVGDTKTTVVVKSRGETTLNTTDASLGTIVDGDRVQDLPSLFVDNAAALLAMAPGVVSGATDTSQEGATTGTRGDQANITLDGLDINDERGGFAFITAVNTPLDSIQELKTTVAGGDASYGHSAGGQVELVTKSGTNDFHGRAYDFNRVTAFAANNFFNNLNKIPKPPLIRNQFGGAVSGPILKNKLFFFFDYSGLRSKASQQINDIVPLDALRRGQLNYINSSSASCGAASNIVATPTCISTTPLAGPNSLRALDPSGIGADQALLNLIKTRPYPEPNNFNTGDLINSAGFGFAAPVSHKDNTFVGRLDYQISTKHRLFARGTWDRSVDDDDANHFARTFPGDPIEAIVVDHSRLWVVGHTWTVSPNIINQASFGETNETLVFPLASAPTFPNLLSFFFNGSVLTAPFDNDINGNPTLNEQFPIVLVYQVRDTLTWNRGKHTLQFGGLIKPTIFKSGNVTDTNEFRVGLGGQLQALDASLRPSNIAGNSAATSEWDSLFPLALGRFASVNSGFNFDKAGKPLPQGTIPIRDYHSTEYEVFAQDTWNIRSDLTMTYGLRWQFHNPLTEVNGFEAVPNLSAQQIFRTRLAQAAAGIEGPNAVPFVSYRLGGSANNAPGYYKPSYTNFAPRLGIAYSPSFTKGFLGHLFGDRKTSIRTGFGVNYDVNLIGQGFELDETSFLFSNSSVTNNGGAGAVGALSPGGDPRFAGVSKFPVVPAPAPLPRPTFTPNVDANGVPIGFNNGGFGSGPFFNFDPNYKTPYEMSFSLGFQRELPGDWFVDVSYFGKLGRKLTALGDPAQTLNFKDKASGQFLYSAFGNVQKQLQAGTPFSAVTSQPWFENQMTAAVTQSGLGSCANIGNFLTQGTFPSLSCTQLGAGLVGAVWPNGDVSSTLLALADIHLTGNVEQGLLPMNNGLLAQDGAAGFIGNFASSTYHSLLVKVNHRLSRNLAMELDYAFAHSIDNDSDVQNSLISFNAAEVCDLRNLRVCRGNSNFDAKHIAAANFEYGLPFGRGQWLGHNSPRWLDEAIGGWKVSGIIRAHSGFPFKVDTGTFPVDFTQTAPAVFVGKQSDVKGNVHAVTQGGLTTIQYFSNETKAVGAFAFPFGGGTGNRNVVRGPGYWNTDIAILKDFTMPWSEQHKLQFRAEGINVFNHVNFSPPNANILSPGSFGKISSTVNDARQLQLGLKYSF